MGKGLQGALLHSLGAQDHWLTVLSKRWLSANLLQVQLESPTLLHQGGERPGSWVRAWFPDPRGSSKEFQRGYTLVDADPSTGRFCFDFVIHEPRGPAAQWALDCSAGDQIVGMRFGEEPFVDPEPVGYLLMGDLAAYPAIRSVAAVLPGHLPVEIILERHTPGDESVPSIEGANVTTTWVDATGEGRDLVEAIAGRDWTGWYVWVTAESTPTRHVKSHLVRERGRGGDLLYAQAYWRRGRAMGRSR